MVFFFIENLLSYFSTRANKKKPRPFKKNGVLYWLFCVSLEVESESDSENPRIENFRRALVYGWSNEFLLGQYMGTIGGVESIYWKSYFAQVWNHEDFLQPEIEFVETRQAHIST